MADSSNEERTLGDLTPSELIDLAMSKVSEAMSTHEKGKPGPASGAYAYLHLAKSKLDESGAAESSKSGTEWTVRSRYETTDGNRVALLISPSEDRFAVSYVYEWPHAPQFIEYTDRTRAFDTFVFSYTAAEARGVVAHREG